MQCVHQPAQTQRPAANSPEERMNEPWGKTEDAPTRAEQRVLDCAARIAAECRAVFQSEICKTLALSPVTVCEIAQRLRAKGLIIYADRHPVRLTDKGRKNVELRYFLVPKDFSEES